MHQVKSRVLKNEKILEGYFRLTLECPEVANNAIPGQFLMVRVGKSYDPLLRRPFSIHKINRNSVSGVQCSEQSAGSVINEPATVQILYKVVGKGTGMMAQIKAGEEVDLIGPLGNGFNFESDIKESVIVGGGVGAAPMLALAEEMKSAGMGKGKERRMVVLLGGRNKQDIICAAEFKELGADVRIATDDGSLGHKGFVTELLEDYLTQPPLIGRRKGTGIRIFSCGPYLMSKRVADLSKNYNAPCQVSLEACMACGVGACLGCVIKVRSPESNKYGHKFRIPNSAFNCGCGSDYISCDTQLPEISYKRVCVEGPVFDTEEVVWE